MHPSSQTFYTFLTVFIQHRLRLWHRTQFLKGSLIVVSRWQHPAVVVRARICLELILNSININLVTYSDLFDSRQLKGDIFAIFVIALAAAEAAIGLSILSSIHRNRKSTRINQSNLLNN